MDSNNKHPKQECIPVRNSGKLWMEKPLDRDPHGRDPNTDRHPRPAGNMRPETETPRGIMGPGSQTGSDPFSPVDRMTDMVKTLPCPKLCGR